MADIGGLLTPLALLALIILTGMVVHSPSMYH
jgi:hypothetical protein